MTRILFYLADYPADPWVDALKAVDPSLDVRTNPDWGSPDDGEAYAFVWTPEQGLIARYPNIKAVFSLGAGVDHLTCDPSLPGNLPIIRMGDEGLKKGMREYITMAVLMFQRGMPTFIARQETQDWQRYFAPAAADTPVGIMGFGALGSYVATALTGLGFPVNSWSQSHKAPQNGVTHYTGSDALEDFLSASMMVVGLLPETPETRHLLNKDRLARMPKGGFILNAGRGGLVDIDALINALDSGHLEGAMLDVFDTEPLPKEHPAWGHDKIIVTPHIAAITRPLTAARYVLDTIKDMENGQTPPLMLDRVKGY